MELKDRDLKTYEDVKKEVKKADKNSLLATIKLYTVPLVSIVLFLGICIIAIFPTITGIFNNYNDLAKLQTQESQNKSTIDKLNVLKQKDDQTLSDLGIIDTIVPSEQTKIVSLQQFIVDKTKLYNLELKDMVIGEQLQKVTDTTTSTSATNTTNTSNTKSSSNFDANGNPIKLTESSLRVAPTTAKIIGKFSDIQSFFADFYKVNDLYIITTMNLKSGGSISPSDLTSSNIKWTLDITFSKYAFSEDFLTSESVFLAIPITTKADQSVIDYLRNRYSK